MWTAPVLVTIQDRESRWEAEDILRQSNCYPSFHWPKEMLEPVKTLRKAIVDSGVDNKTNYIRIRPDDRDSRMSNQKKARQNSPPRPPGWYPPSTLLLGQGTGRCL